MRGVMTMLYDNVLLKDESIHETSHISRSIFGNFYFKLTLIRSHQHN